MTAIRKHDTSSAGRISTDASPATPSTVATAPAAAPTRGAAASNLFPDVFEAPKSGGVSGGAKVASKPSTEESLAELQMLRALTSGDAQGAQEARDAMQSFRAQREGGKKA